MTVDMVDKDHTFQCTATNKYNGVKHSRSSTIFAFAVRNETSMLSYSDSIMPASVILTSVIIIVTLSHAGTQHSSAAPTLHETEDQIN